MRPDATPGLMTCPLPLPRPHICGRFAPADGTRLLRTVRDFVLLFEKGMADIKVGGWGWDGRC